MARSKMNNAQRIQKLLDVIKSLDEQDMKDYISSFIPYLELVSADDFEDAARHHHNPRVVFAYTVRPEHCNRLGNMHGGATATLFDFGTSLAMALLPEAKPTPENTDAAGNASSESSEGESGEDEDEDEDVIRSWQRLGVSRTLAVTYVRPAPCNSEVLLECEQVHAGKRMSSLRGVLRRRRDGAVLATCEHGKVILEPEYVPSPKL
ncbi:hypothetical protein SEUCBS139899_009670 [Sporothrix eucalyptigena]|uniref:Thioesterase domain-containing protein n=1 Tax=Sporothrix eucalyptigena TaxID=1812306 RepID=A0ABP0BDX3_9PEZI